MGSDPGGDSMENQAEPQEWEYPLNLSSPAVWRKRKVGKPEGETWALFGPGLYKIQFSASLVLARESDSWYHAHQGHVHLILTLQRSSYYTSALCNYFFSWLTCAEGVPSGTPLVSSHRECYLRDPARPDLGISGCFYLALHHHGVSSFHWLFHLRFFPSLM